MNRLTFIIGTSLALLVTFLSISGTAYTMDKNSGKSNLALEKYYHEVEQSYVSEVRDYLNKKGYSNSGVMLTKTISEDGSRDYVLSIHHKRLSAENERTDLVVNDIEKIEFEVEGINSNTVVID